MKTSAGESGGVVYIYHWLADDETWEKWGMDQPNSFWSHVQDFRGCPVCERPLRRAT